MPFKTELKQIKASQKNFLPRVIQKVTPIKMGIKSRLSKSAIFPSGVVYLNLDDASYKKRISKRFKAQGGSPTLT